MTAELPAARSPLEEVRATLEREDRSALLHAQLGLLVRGAVLALMAGYMVWLSGAMSRLSAPELTRFAAAHLESRLPELRAELRDYAIEQAPEITDRARDLLLAMPAQARRSLEERLLSHADGMFDRLEVDLDAAVDRVIDDQMEQVRSRIPDASPEEQLDAFLAGIHDRFRQAMLDAVDDLYVAHSGEIRQLDDYMIHLQRDPGLTESERLDRELLETWVLLVHQDGIADTLFARDPTAH